MQLGLYCSWLCFNGNGDDRQESEIKVTTDENTETHIH